ncbi:ABC transporter substrate-binding protein [Psychrobacillus sp.]|uniref:ABC transporter substrate-binding protein n=1 Tax=Psychrobacillus sp. TaxID=1871623 RepID=UPI0028BD398E|nr:ABC transporter substrate-binding protein [Psychrobacillus sp.]
MKATWAKGLSYLTLTSILLAGCASNSTKTESESIGTSSGSSIEQSAKSGGVVRFAMATEVDSLDPYQSAATDTSSMMDNVFDGLFDTNEKGELIPNLADSYEISEDGLTYMFQLKEGVKFHDGSDFSAEDVVYSYSKLAGLKTGEPMNSKFAGISSIEVVSDYEVVVSLKEIDSSFIARNIVAIVPSDYEQQSKQPIGAGPFKFKEYKAGQQLVLVKNADYYLEGKTPKVDEVQFKIMPDAQSSILAMQAGEIDVLPGITEQGLMQLGDSVEVVSGPQNMVQLMALNNSFGPLSDIRVRQAINYAIDKDSIIDTVAEGKATKLGSNFSPAMDFYFEEGLENFYETNIEKAKQLMAEAGFADGFDLQLTVPSDYQFHVDTAQMLASQLQQININVKIEPIEFSTWLERVYTNAEYESTVISFTGKLDPFEVVGRFVSDYPKNFVKFDNEKFDSVLDSAVKEKDEKEKANLYKEAQRILTEEAGSVFIMDPDRSIAMANGLTGFKMFPVQKYNLEDLEFTE